jgi:hypothetical protein
MANYSTIDVETLRAALIGFEHRKAEVEAKMAEIRRQIGGGPKVSATAAPASEEAPRTRRKMSASARKRIAAAQKKRWAAFHASTGAPSKRAAATKKKTGGKRKMSAEGRRRIAEATRRRWAAARAEKMAAGSAIP